jgi:hypothetical protein
MQTRAKIGVEFEKECEIDGWVRKSKSPKPKWIGNGKNNFEKIINCGYNPSEFKLDEKSDLIKYDIYHPDLGTYREVKRYSKNNLNSWTLYSEPYFKVAQKSDIPKIGKDEYNKFVDNFYEHYKNTGLFERVQRNMNNVCEGVLCLDGFIPKEELEFRTIVQKNEWKGYYRITIQFKLK